MYQSVDLKCKPQAGVSQNLSSSDVSFILEQMGEESYFEAMMLIADEQVNLAEAALQIAVLEYPDLNIKRYLDMLDVWHETLRNEFGNQQLQEQVKGINDFLFDRMHFTGNIENYYDPKNSFLNEVIDRKTGIPITLSILYLEMAWHLGLQASGIGFPGHFLVRILTDGSALYIDPYHSGRIMTVAECRDFWDDLSEGEVAFQESFLTTVTKRQILSRMLRNLKGIYLETKNYRKLIPVLDRLVILCPDVPEEIRDRGIIHYQCKAYKLAQRDFESFLSFAPDAEDADVIRQHLEVLRDYAAKLN